MAKDARVDAYIEKAADFARPILTHLRDTVHAACPEVEEGLKWSMPAFLYRGRILASMASFKAHATFGFWDHNQVVGEPRRGGMGQFGRIASVDDLPPRPAIEEMVRRARALIDEGARPKREVKRKPELAVPDYLRAAIDADPKATATFDNFPPSCRREYVEWVTEAKRDDTRARRVEQTVQLLAEGKKRHWKYENC